MTWPPDELNRIIDADDLHIAPLRRDGVTPGTPTWIWAVQVNGQLYVRAYNGQSSRWYQAAKALQAGRIRADGRDLEVSFTLVEGPVNDDIDEAYRTKYAGSPYLPPMIGERARAATVRIDPTDPPRDRPDPVSDR